MDNADKERIEELEAKVDTLEKIIAKICILKSDGSRWISNYIKTDENWTSIDDELVDKINDLRIRQG